MIFQFVKVFCRTFIYFAEKQSNDGHEMTDPKLIKMVVDSGKKTVRYIINIFSVNVISLPIPNQEIIFNS